MPNDKKHTNPDVNAGNENKISEAVPVRKKNSRRIEHAPSFEAAFFEKFSEKKIFSSRSVSVEVSLLV